MKKGEKPPNFTLEDQDGNPTNVSFDDGKKKIIYFYPKDNTKVCTEQACSFRDWQDVLLEKGFQLIGISGDPPESHLKFKAQHHLNFTLLSDPKGKVRKIFGATFLFGLLPSRKTFVINEKGNVEFSFEALMKGEEHIDQVLEYIEEVESV